MLSPLSVDPAHQRQGIGTLLVRAAVDAAAEAGSPAVFLEGSADYYGTRGFERASAARLHPAVGADPGPGLPGGRAGRARGVDDGGVGLLRGFWALDCVGLRDPLLAELEESLSEG